MSSLVPDPPGTPVTPCKLEVLHLFRWYTHTDTQTHRHTDTHTRPEPGQPSKARGRKNEHRRRAEGQNRAGGEGNKRTSKTNLHGETDLTKTAHTPKLHDALRRGTRGKLGTKWGTSWWQTRKPKQLIKQQDSVPNYLKVVRYSLSGTVVKSCPNWHKRLSSSKRIRCTTCFTSPDTKETTPAGKGHACCLLSLMSCCIWNAEAGVKRFLIVRHGFTVEEMHWRGIPGTTGAARLRQRHKTVRPTVALYLDELLIQKCKFGRQFSRHSPQIGLPHLALWHHVGVTIGITLDKNGSL